MGRKFLSAALALLFMSQEAAKGDVLHGHFLLPTPVRKRPCILQRILYGVTCVVVVTC